MPPNPFSRNGGTIYFRQNSNSSNIEYSFDSNSWTEVSFPVTIENTNDILTVDVEFTTDITFTSNDNYFICGSEYITFDGKNNTCTFDNINNYLGLIQNGSNAVTGYSYVTVKNIKTASNGSILNEAAGWVCQYLFGKFATNNILITNC